MQLQPTGQNVQEFDARVFVRSALLLPDWFEFGEVRIQSAVRDREVQALEIVAGLGRIRGVRKAQTVLFTNDFQHRPRFRVEEVLQAYAENHRDTKQGGQGRMHYVPLELREQSQGQAGVLA